MKKAGVCFLSVAFLASIALWLRDPYEDDPADTYRWLSELAPEYEPIRSYAESHIGCIADFRHLFPHSDVVVFPRFPKNSSTHITCHTLVYGRYYVQLSQRIRTSRGALTAVPLGDPELAVLELEQIGCMAANGGLTKYGKVQRYLGGRAWRRLVASGGDLSAVIDNPIKDRPLEFADQYLAELTADQR